MYDPDGGENLPNVKKNFSVLGVPGDVRDGSSLRSRAIWLPDTGYWDNSADSVMTNAEK